MTRQTCAPARLGPGHAMQPIVVVPGVVGNDQDHLLLGCDKLDPLARDFPLPVQPTGLVHMDGFIRTVDKHTPGIGQDVGVARNRIGQSPEPAAVLVGKGRHRPGVRQHHAIVQGQELARSACRITDRRGHLPLHRPGLGVHRLELAFIKHVECGQVEERGRAIGRNTPGIGRVRPELAARGVVIGAVHDPALEGRAQDQMRGKGHELVAGGIVPLPGDAPFLGHAGCVVEDHRTVRRRAGHIEGQRAHQQALVAHETDDVRTVIVYRQIPRRCRLALVEPVGGLDGIGHAAGDFHAAAAEDQQENNRHRRKN